MSDITLGKAEMLALAEKIGKDLACTRSYSMHEWTIIENALRLAAKPAEEVRVTTEMVRAAFNEGFIQGTAEHTSSKGGYSWHDSKAKAALSLTGAPKP